MIHKMFYNGNGKKNSKIRVQEQRRRNYCSSSDVVRRYGCSGAAALESNVKHEWKRDDHVEHSGIVRVK